MSLTAALIAATATFFAAVVSFSGFLIAKDLKITEFRQAWINEQRTDLAIIIAEFQSYRRLSKGKLREACLRSFDEAATRISLRENPVKPEWQQPLNTIKDLRVMMVESRVFGSERQVQYLIDQAQSLLKIEWDRVRDGEKDYRYTRRNIPRIAIGAAALFLMLLWAIGYRKGFIVLALTP